MAERRSILKRWGAIVGITVGTMTVITLSFAWCDRAGLATPLEAASREDVKANTERISKLETSINRMEGKIDLLLNAIGIEYTVPKE